MAVQDVEYLDMTGADDGCDPFVEFSEWLEPTEEEAWRNLLVCAPANRDVDPYPSRDAL